MKQILILRHAQAASAKGGDDRARTLTPVGKEDAKALGMAMHRKGLRPDIVLCSSAQRTKETLEGVLAAFEDEDIPVRYLDRIYGSATGDLFALVQNLEEDYDTALIVGHAPAIYELAVLLSGQGAPSLLNRLSGGYKPGTLSVVAARSETWNVLQPAENELTALLEPLDYNAPATPARWT